MQGCTRMQPVTIRRQQRQQRRSTAAAAVALTVYQQVHFRAGAAGWHSQTLQERAEHEVAWCGAAACEEASGTGNVACKQDVGELSTMSHCSCFWLVMLRRQAPVSMRAVWYTRSGMRRLMWPTATDRGARTAAAQHWHACLVAPRRRKNADLNFVH
jgi:hypothetical protein